MPLTPTLRHGLVSLCATTALGLAAHAPSMAAEPAPPSPTAAGAEAAANPGLVLGKTQLDQAQQLWAERGARVVQGGQVAVGGGSGVDGLGTIGVPELLLLDVTGFDFEGLPAARYAFVDGTLYSIQVRLQPPFAGRDQGAIFPPVSDDDVASLEKRLRKSYGPPTRSGNELAFEKNRKPDMFLWNLGDRELVLSVRTPMHGSQLMLTHKALARTAEKFKRMALDKARAK